MTPTFKESDGSFPVYFYALAAVTFVLYNIPLYAIFVSKMAFFARISDPFVGGTYMTLLNTFQNLGYMWPSSFVFWTVDQVTRKSCIFQNDLGASLSQNISMADVGLESVEGECYGAEMVEQCKESGGVCQTVSNGKPFKCQQYYDT